MRSPGRVFLTIWTPVSPRCVALLNGITLKVANLVGLRRGNDKQRAQANGPRGSNRFHHNSIFAVFGAAVRPLSLGAYLEPMQPFEFCPSDRLGLASRNLQNTDAGKTIARLRYNGSISRSLVHATPPIPCCRCSYCQSAGIEHSKACCRRPWQQSTYLCYPGRRHER